MVQWIQCAIVWNNAVGDRWLLKTSPHLICVATLPCNLLLITTLVWDCRLFLNIDVLPGSLAMHIRCGEIFNNHIIANYLANLSVKIFWVFVKIWQSYCREFGVSFFTGHGVLILKWVCILCLIGFMFSFHFHSFFASSALFNSKIRAYSKIQKHIKLQTTKSDPQNSFNHFQTTALYLQTMWAQS